MTRYLALLLMLSSAAYGQPQSPGYNATVLTGLRSHFQQDGDPTGLGFLQNPGGLAVDSSGRLYYSTGRYQKVTIPPGTYRDVGYFGVRAGDPAGEVRTLYGCTTAGVAAGDCGVTGLISGFPLAVDRTGRLILANPATREIVALHESGPQLLAVAPSGVQITSLALGLSSEIYVASRAQHRVWRVDAQGSFVEMAGTGVCGFSGDGGPAHNAQLCDPQSMAADRRGNIYIADSGNNCITS